MNVLRLAWKKILWISLASWAVGIVLHRLMPLKLASHLPQSLVVQKGLMLPVAGSALLLTLIILAGVFVLIQERLPGKRLAKGITYGLLVSLLWLVGFVEPSAILGTSFSAEVYNWLPDGLVIILMGIGLGLFAVSDSPPVVPGEYRRRIAPAMLAAAVCFGGRYFAYIVLGTNAPFDPQPWPVLAWTIVISLLIGVKYLILGQAAPSGSPVRRAVWFGGLVIGLDWLIGQMFFLIFYQLPAINLLGRAACDIALITLGAWAAERLLAGRASFQAQRLPFTG